jgi:hypothetical protein
MFRAGLTLVRRVICAASLLLLLICGAEVAVRIYEAATDSNVYSSTDGLCSDPSKLTVPSWSFYQELKPMAAAKVECRDSESEVDIRTNSLGVRGAELTFPKPRDLFRIVVLGDETLFAPETRDADHFCRLLQMQLQKSSNVPIEVVNAAIPGHCPLTEFLFFKQRLLSLSVQPDLVLLHFDWSDVADDRQIRRLATCDDVGIPQSCPHINSITSKKVRLHEVWRQQFRLLDLGLNALSAEWKQQIAQQRAVSRDSDMNPYAWLREDRPGKNLSFYNSVRPIEDLAQLCESVNLPFVVMTSPKPWQVSEKCSRGEGVRLAAGVSQNACFSNRAPFDVLARFADRANAPFIDGSIALASGPDPEANFLTYAPRWSPRGHLRMAELVANALSQSVQGPWNRSYFPQNEQPVSRGLQEETPIQRTSGQRSGTERIVREPVRPLR